jgi:hypothetical protein
MGCFCGSVKMYLYMHVLLARIFSSMMTLNDQADNITLLPDLTPVACTFIDRKT